MALGDVINSISSVQNALEGKGTSPLSASDSAQLKSDGFLISAVPGADGNGLPYNSVPNQRAGQLRRNIITWFVPEFGIVRMYVNPSQIVYSDKKHITKERTKGGFSLQYWGEELTTLNITGTTGASGIEGINVLHEIYRAEQLGFDSTGLSLAANNANAPNLLNGIASMVGTPSAATSTVLGGIGGMLGLSTPNTGLVASNIPSLASLAFRVELYYNGWVYRGYFESMNFTESATDFLMNYNITFIATQRRGYRTNFFAFNKSAKNGPSSYDDVRYNKNDGNYNTNDSNSQIINDQHSFSGYIK
jgi:hypothetical protein